MSEFAFAICDDLPAYAFGGQHGRVKQGNMRFAAFLSI